MTATRETVQVHIIRTGCCATPREAIAAAARAGITLVQPDPRTINLVDNAGNTVPWWVSGNTLYLSMVRPDDVPGWHDVDTSTD